jgi:hypothetical protein
MKTITNITYSALALLALAWCAFSPTPNAFGVDPRLDRGYPNQNTAEDDNALFNLTIGADNTAMGFDVLDSNIAASDNALASWIWTATRGLNTARYAHTATLLQNGMVLVAAGIDSNFIVSASTELYDRPAVPGLPQAASTRDVICTRRRCYKTA